MNKLFFIVFLLYSGCAYAAQNCGFINGTYFCLQNIDSSAINWTSLSKVIGSSAINWQDPNGVVIGRAINWNDINIIAKINSGAVNWPSLNKNITNQAVNWLDFKALDTSYGSHSGINWQSLGV